MIFFVITFSTNILTYNGYQANQNLCYLNCSSSKISSINLRTSFKKVLRLVFCFCVDFKTFEH